MGAVNLIIVSDIFGRTPELIELASAFSDRYDHIHIIDPYDGFMNKRSEHFDAAGYRKYLNRIK